ncbi:MAG: hypothetical protein R2911_21920 [Caldilineaceae bacterium]
MDATMPCPHKFRRAGPLTMIYENGDLRYIKLGAREIVRRLYVAIRNRNWDTAANLLSDVQMEIGADSFTIRYICTNKLGDIDFVWRGELHGAADGLITCRMDGEARTTFLRNRIGFCLLHPAAIAGAAARIEHVDGTTEENAFPVHIAPQFVINGEIKPVAPFNEMAAVAHAVQPGVWAQVRFAGDIFEMEDQRNWTDASYKTYGTPLRLPFPAEVTAGTKIAQTVTIGLIDGPQAAGAQAAVDAAESIKFTIGQARTKLPRIGLGVASHGQLLSSQEITRLQALKLSHLRVDLRLGEADTAAALRRAMDEANELGVALEVALHLTDNGEAELQGLAELVKEMQPPVATWLVFHVNEKVTTARWIQLVRQVLAPVGADAHIGGGTNIYFTELNSRRPDADALAAADLMNWSVNPQVHAFDNASLVETVAAQAVTATSARQFCGDRQLSVSPITLAPRFNPNATGPAPEPAPGELPPPVDPRQMSLFGAGWTLGSLKCLAETGALDSVTYFETTGWRGVMEIAAGSPLPDKFASIPGGVFPLYHLLADVGEFAGTEVVRSQSSQPLHVDGLVLTKEGRTRVLLANFTAQSRQVTVSGLAGAVELRRLDAANAEAAMREPERFRAGVGERLAAAEGRLQFELPPFAVARLDSNTDDDS